MVRTERKLLSRAEVQEMARQRRAARTAKQVKRGVKKVSKGHRFPDLVNEPLRKFVRGLPCVLTGLTDGAGIVHKCRYPMGIGTSYVAHLKTRGSGGGDDDNVFPACWWAHWKQEGNTKRFEAEWGIKLAAICRKVTAKFYKEYPGLRETGRTL